MHAKVNRYVRIWKDRCYFDGIPDEVPDSLMNLNLAPSYKAIAIALLRSDVSLISLGFVPVACPWYCALKRIEISQRPGSSIIDEEPLFTYGVDAFPTTPANLFQEM